MTTTQRENTKAVRGRTRAAHGLTPRQLSCLALSSCEGLTQQQIARRLGIGQRSVSQHIAAARKKLTAAGRALPAMRSAASGERRTLDPAGLEAVDHQRIVTLW